MIVVGLAPGFIVAGGPQPYSVVAALLVATGVVAGWHSAKVVEKSVWEIKRITIPQLILIFGLLVSPVVTLVAMFP